MARPQRVHPRRQARVPHLLHQRPRRRGDGYHLELPRHDGTRASGDVGGLAAGLSPEPTVQVVELARELRPRRRARPEVGRSVGRRRGRLSEARRLPVRYRDMSPQTARGGIPERASERAFFGISALLFAASAAMTIAWCASMSAVGGMAMPGGWTMSMAWMRMPGQTWPGAAASFLGMWIVMMVAMMLPSLVPMLWRYRQAAGRTGEPHPARLTVLVSLGYFSVWTVLGMAAFALGVALAALEMQRSVLARAAPVAVGVVVLIAGALQFSPWKARQLACCRAAPDPRRRVPADAATAWRDGLRLGVHCSYCCAGPTAILLVVG